VLNRIPNGSGGIRTVSISQSNLHYRSREFESGAVAGRIGLRAAISGAADPQHAVVAITRRRCQLSTMIARLHLDRFVVKIMPEKPLKPKNRFGRIKDHEHIFAAK
jgi:hypothetical protein